MKHSVIITLFFAVFSMLFFSCDKIDPPYKKSSTVTSSRKVLLEDYTGFLCINCPEAAVAIHDLIDVYGDNIIPISVHSGFQAVPGLETGFTYDFRTPVGTAWHDEFAIQYYPLGVINRATQEDGTKTVNYNNWPVVVSKEIQKEAIAEITLDATFDCTDSSFIVNVETNIDGVSGENYYINVVLTEDSIIQPQKNSNANIGPTPIIWDYAHMHVMRASFTGIWGVEVNPAVVDQKVFTLTDFPEDVVIKNCHVVAFISKSDKEVVQAARAGVN